MSISLNKKTGINLSKGSRISLEKAGKNLEHVCIGLNWGAIKTKEFFGLFSSNTEVDLDGCVAIFDQAGKELDTVYYHQLLSKDGAIRHSGDDLSGDSNGDDGKDNEIIVLDLNKINPNATQIFFFLNSYKGQNFASIPYAKIRIFEGSPKKVDDVLATFNLASDPANAKAVSMIMGKLERKGNGWDFTSIGDGLTAPRIQDIITVIQKKYF